LTNNIINNTKSTHTCYNHHNTRGTLYQLFQNVLPSWKIIIAHDRTWQPWVPISRQNRYSTSQAVARLPLR